MNPPSAESRAPAIVILLFLLVFLTLTALYGGIALTMDPSGGLLKMPRKLLNGTPFSDYRIPGLVLAFLIGGSSLVAAYSLGTGKRWAGLASIGVGVSLLVWITVQMLLIGYVSFLQPSVVLVAVAILILGLHISRTRKPNRA